jgi:dinuclear metal center YbgI/SA1388 family protein
MPVSRIARQPVLREFIKRFEEGVASLDIAARWDNVGLLLESPHVAASHVEELHVRVCIDLTPEVVKEAKKANEHLIVTYHPQLFKAVNAITLTNNEALLQCVAAGISVFSPHTSIDPDINNYLLDAFIDHQASREGSVILLAQPIHVEEVVGRIKYYLKLDRLRFANGGNKLISSIAVCAGSGGSALSGTVADLYWTGEMSHHEVLDCVKSGISVVLCEHSNTERPYLPTLSQKLREVVGVASVTQSACDADPLVIV